MSLVRAANTRLSDIILFTSAWAFLMRSMSFHFFGNLVLSIGNHGITPNNRREGTNPFSIIVSFVELIATFRIKRFSTVG